MDESPMATEMLAGWAHDLGKPLQVIAIHGRRLADEVGLKDETVALARAIVALSDDALGVVDRLMEAARPEQERKRKSPWEGLHSTLASVIDAVQRLHPDCRLRLDGTIPALELKGWREIHSVLVNLSDNAIRASGDHQPILIRARCFADRLRIEVVDRGHGMSTSVKARAFHPYFSTQRSSHVTGLGLVQCCRLLKSIGGEISLESKKGLGTCVSVILPRDGFRKLSRS
ncbi:MAG: HAMP domain-containing sensor histidine kinase [Myxococcota bacterium]